VTETERQTVQVDIISDVMCPWCYVGKRRFEKAVAACPDLSFDVRWRPFQLDSTLPEEGIDRRAYLEGKFGSKDRAREIYETIKAAGEGEDLAFRFDRIKLSVNTLKAHALIRWAVSVGAQDAVVERLFELYFMEGGNLADHDALVETARAAGMDADLVADLLDKRADLDKVAEEVALAGQMGVTGVPCFIINNRYAVMGAQSPEILAETFHKAAEEAPYQEGASG